MNLELLESFGQNYPEESDGVLDSISMALTIGFNRKGTLLAVGCNDGRVFVWDFLTRGIAKTVIAHIHPVCSVCFSRDGRKILSASTDNTICVVDVLSGDCDHRFRFPCPVLKAQYNPRNSNEFLVCPMRHPALICTIDGDKREIPLGDGPDDNDLIIVASYDRRGQYVFTGNSKGKLAIYRASDLEIVASFRIGQSATSSTAIKSIEFSRRGDSFLLNSADRIIRVYSGDMVLELGKDCDPEPIQKLQDLVNKTMWKKCCFSGDGDYVCAGSARSHSLYIWEKNIGNLVKILHGTKGELLLDVVWHPMRPIVASVSNGVVSIWSQNQVENWSAFAPDFKELDENVEYEERESEFDLEDEDKMVGTENGDEEDDLEVDVITTTAVRAYLSSDEEYDDPDQLLFLPIAPEIEDVEDQTWNAPEGNEDSRKRYHSSEQKENSPHRRKKPKVHDINLDNAPTDEIHPLLANRPSKDKSSNNNKKNSHSHRAKSESKKYKERSGK